MKVSYGARPFARGHHQKFSGEAFLVTKRYKRQGNPVYQLSDLRGEVINGTFYQQELQKVIYDPDKLYEIDRVIKFRGRGKNREALVSFKQWNKKFRQWLPERYIKTIKKK